jgi:hypothetical protein
MSPGRILGNTLTAWEERKLLSNGGGGPFNSVAMGVASTGAFLSPPNSDVVDAPNTDCCTTATCAFSPCWCDGDPFIDEKLGKLEIDEPLRGRRAGGARGDISPTPAEDGRWPPPRGESRMLARRNRGEPQPTRSSVELLVD